MRIATSMIFDAGVASINRQWSQLLHLQQQVASGRRILTPADDPVAAARALEVTQSADILSQFSTNQKNAVSALGLAEAQLTSLNDMFARLKELTVQAGNATLSANDRQSIAFELRARFDELLGIANAADGQGQYLFSGFMGATKPFAGTVEGGVAYAGDDGQRKLQVSATRMLEVSDSGRDIFQRIRNGNGTFVTAYGAGNTGAGIIDAGSVTGNFVADTYTVSFAPSAGGLDYTVTGAASGVVATGVYRSGAAIGFNGATVTITGSPAAGDTFTIAPSATQGVFETLGRLILALESNSALPADAAKYANEVGFALRDLDQANDNFLRVRSMIGSRMSELESLGQINQDLRLQYQQTLSQLQDLDYAKAISDLTRKQTDLQAAQQSFVKISQLSLFNYL
ncbi:MAG: flagellar hook-associated protein FlgL [Sulfuritalea sp.]|nr:flagellar hook-associated protein FlgL [Sulfuritalea sp.]